MRTTSKHAFLLCNGEPPSRSLARRLARETDYIIAADGGANIALRLGVRPQTIVGDFDSILDRTKARFSSSLLLRIRRQDNTDFEKALDFLAAQKIRNVTVAGITGKRLDFTLANLSVLWRYADHMDLEIIGDGWMAFPVTHRKELRAPRGTTVSIIPFSPCSGVTLNGLKYRLRNARLRLGEVGVSNVVVHSPFSVKLTKGHLLVLVLEHGQSKRKHA
jgi:thiamine pyrophosphokinase